jgi:linoleate 10R-lipoxygenase
MTLSHDPRIYYALQVLHALFPEENSLNQHAAWFAKAVKDKIREKTWQWVISWVYLVQANDVSPRYPNVSGNYVDIVKDVINIVSTHVSADKLVSYLNKLEDSSYLHDRLVFR